MAKTNSGLVQFMKDMVGQAYWTGCYGQTATASLLASKKAQYPSSYTASDYESQIAKGMRVGDCSGYVKGYLWGASKTAQPTYQSATDWNQQGMYTRATTKGSIASFPKYNGLLVFIGNSATSLTHVGVYADGYVYHAADHSRGVIKAAYTNGVWNYWAQYSEITDDTSGGKTTASSDLVVDGSWGSLTTTKLQTYLGCSTVDGIVSNQYKMYKADNPGLDSGWDWCLEKSYSGTKCSIVIKTLQKKIGMSSSQQDGHIGPITITALQKYLGTTQDGFFSYPSDAIKEMQTRLNKGTF